jgi:hypothetical protein
MDGCCAYPGRNQNDAIKNPRCDKLIAKQRPRLTPKRIRAKERRGRQIAFAEKKIHDVAINALMPLLLKIGGVRLAKNQQHRRFGALRGTAYFNLPRIAQKTPIHVRLDRIIRKPFRQDDKFLHGPSILEAKCIRAALPVLARYTCTRLGEICALHPSDVKQIEGVATLEINEEGRRRLNTSNAARDPFAQRDFTPLLSGFSSKTASSAAAKASVCFLKSAVLRVTFRTFSASALLVSFISSDTPMSDSFSIVSDIGASNP